ncbi:galectin-9-like isoform X2 [Daphnia carinata]|uniref:galectin-9-like isoform X2 n=1 Tax=Daphnia carinata TaxID=120202 RepID=UPI0025811305|nr:galectin-9-like isoform X2 [Daphnia carinata]
MMTITNPVIPYVTGLPGGCLQVGSMIIVHGQPTFNCNRFSINLVHQGNMYCIFHFNARFDQGQVVRNTNFPSSTWGPEERSALPFTRNKPFFLEIRCLQDRFMVAIDGNHYCEYAHRVSYSQANTLQITGDVQVSTVEFRSTNTYPTFPSGNRLNVANPPIPFASSINGPLSVGNEIQIHGQVKPHPNRFHINLQQGCQSPPSPTIVFHFNPRYEGGNRVIVMNSLLGGQWGSEQRIASGRLLAPGTTFVLIIRRQAYNFEILINATTIAHYAHRIGADIVDSVTIDGDVIVGKVVAI